MRSSKKLILFTKGNQYLLKDTFSQTIVAGSINGTQADIGGARTVTDTNSKFSIGSGVLTLATGNAANDRMTYPSLPRLAGRIFLADFKFQTGASRVHFGFGLSTSDIADSGFNIRASDFRWLDGGGGNAIGVLVANTNYKLAVVMRTTGTYLFLKGGVYANWSLVWKGEVGATATVFPGFFSESTTDIFTLDNFKIPSLIWLPSPSASDGFSVLATTDGAGHAETSGLGTGGSGKSWTDQAATWAIGVGKVTNTPTLGSEVIVNGAFAADTDWNKGAGWAIAAGVATGATASSDITAAVAPLAVGTWYQTVFTISAFTSGTVRVKLGTTSFPTHASAATFTETGLAASTAFALTGASLVGSIDNVSTKALTLNTLFRSLTSLPKDYMATVGLVISAGTQAGLVLNLDSASSPANFVIAYHDGTNATLLKCVAGVYTSVISAAATYSSGAELRVIKNGTTYSLYYNKSQVGSNSTISDAGIISNTIHGLFSTISTNTMDNFTIYPQGVGNEHSILDTI